MWTKLRFTDICRPPSALGIIDVRMAPQFSQGLLRAALARQHGLQNYSFVWDTSIDCQHVTSTTKYELTHRHRQNSKQPVDEIGNCLGPASWFDKNLFCIKIWTDQCKTNSAVLWTRRTVLYDIFYLSVPWRWDSDHPDNTGLETFCPKITNDLRTGWYEPFTNKSPLKTIYFLTFGV